MLTTTYIIIGFFLGLLGGWYVTNAKLGGQRQALQATLEGVGQQLEETKETLAVAQSNNLVLTQSFARLEAENEHLAEKLGEQKKEVTAMQDKLTVQFKNLANELLEEKSKRFTDQNKSNIEGLLKPLGERIQAFEKQIVQTNKEGLERNVALRTEVKKLYELNTQMTKGTENLTKALKGDNKTQGNWGEFILESILEKSCLVKNREYSVQESFVGEDGKRYQPDIIVKLPDNKHIIIDSKVSLVDYEQSCSAAEEQERTVALKRHLDSIRRHIKGLSAKSYQTQYSLKGLDFVLMFIPIEPAFGAVIQHDPGLYNEAHEKNIVLVSPSTLYATLSTIASIWKHEYQSQNALEIAQQGGALYDKFVGFVEDLQQLGRQMNTTQETYGKAMNKLSEGQGNLVRRAEKIKALGARTSKALDQQLIDGAGATG